VEGEENILWKTSFGHLNVLGIFASVPTESKELGAAASIGRGRTDISNLAELLKRGANS
jgi:hypothetical protein